MRSWFRHLWHPRSGLVAKGCRRCVSRVLLGGHPEGSSWTDADLSDCDYGE